jgi:hypothetical protein
MFPWPSQYYSCNSDNKFDYDKTYYKVMAKNMIHHGYEYKIGLNILIEDFIEDGYCNVGGLYFCDIKDVIGWLYLHEDGYIAEIKIPDDARVVNQENKYKADKLIVENLISIEEFIFHHNLKMVAVLANPKYLKYVMDQTVELCEIALNKDPLALEHVKDQTAQLCNLALKNNIHAFKHIKNKPIEFCISILEYNGYLIEYIQNPTPVMYQIAVDNILKRLNMVEPVVEEPTTSSSTGARHHIKNYNVIPTDHYNKSTKRRNKILKCQMIHKCVKNNRIKIERRCREFKR